MENKYIELIKKYDEYLEFLNNANDDPISVAIAHGWKCREEHITKGIQLRKEISDLKKELQIVN